jgi:RNA polymerase sigma factor (sigma-70 family)
MAALHPTPVPGPHPRHPPEPAGGADADLLARFQRDGDGAAFELLLWRHGPMVMGVCRHVLRDAHAAEDAFQATFLALARKAGSIGRRESVAGWLYTVAYRVALRARASRARLAAREVTPGGPWPTEPACRPDDGPEWRELRPLLQAEVDRLPPKFRAVVVLCYLEGRTNEEAAAQLGCPKGTVLSRLARARERLRGRLSARGVTLAAAPLAFLLSEYGGALAKVTPVLIHATVHAALLLRLGKIASGIGPALELLEEALPVGRGRLARRALAAAAALLLFAYGVAWSADWALSGPTTPATYRPPPSSAATAAPQTPPATAPAAASGCHATTP